MEEYQDTHSETTRIKISKFQDPVYTQHAMRVESRLKKYTFNKQFLDLLESVYDAVIITEIDGNVIKCNTRALELFSYTQEEFWLRNIVSLISGATGEVLGSIRESLSNDRRVFIEAYCRCQDHSQFPAEITANLVHLEEHGLRLCFFIRNVTLRKKTEEALQAAQQELIEQAHTTGMAEIATGILHDIGNIMNSANVSCDIISSSTSKDPLDALKRTVDLLIQQEDLGDFFTSDERAAKVPCILDKVLQILNTQNEKLRKETDNLKVKLGTIKDVISTQQSYAKGDMFVENVNLKNIVEDSLSIVKAGLTPNSIQINMDLTDNLVVQARKSNLIHVFVNLIQNAKDATSSLPRGDRIIEIETGLCQDGIYSRISDNGEGIPEDRLEQIFSHGYTTKASGHGFGLHMCANFIATIGGKIWAESEGSGLGSSFFILFPIPENEDEVSE